MSLFDIFKLAAQYAVYCWPWLAYAVVSMIGSELMERMFVAPDKPWLGCIYPRRAQALIPVVGGGFLGCLVLEDLLEKCHLGCSGAALYFSSAGAVGIVAWDALTDFLKKKYGVTLHLPGDDQ